MQKTALRIFALMAFSGGMCVRQACSQQVQVSPANRTIAVTATENAERRAERAILHVGYHVYAADSVHAYAEAAHISQAVAGALAQAGVAKDAIASESQSTGPAPEFQNPILPVEELAHRKFEAQQSWTVKTTPDAVARLLAAAVAAGANLSGQIDWSVADDDGLITEASTKALAKARGLAAQIAKGLDARVGNLLYASNLAEIAPQMMQGMNGRGLDHLVAVTQPTLNLSAPMITRSATVSAIFAVE